MIEYTAIVRIVLNMVNGVYLFYPWSGTGKSYLYKKLRDLQNAGRHVVAYTYLDYMQGVHLRTLVETINPEVIMLDRADRYMKDTEVMGVIREYGKKAIVLISNKREEIPGIEWETADIQYTDGAILVEG